MNKNIEEEFWICKNEDCGCDVLEKVTLSRHPDSHSVIPTQSIPCIGETYYFYRCIACGALNEPRVQRLSRDSFDREYQQFLDHLTEKGIKIF
jgi:hypothetical protein